MFSLSPQTAADRCKVKFKASESDKQNRWIVTESCPVPTLIGSKQQTPDVSPGKEDTPSEEGVEEESAIAPTPASKSKISRRGRKGQKGRPKGEIYFTDYEHEMIEWARNGFQPTGPEGLWPTEEEQQDLFMVVSADTVDPTGDGNGEMFDLTPPPPKKKFAAMMKQQKGKFYTSSYCKLVAVCITYLCVALHMAFFFAIFCRGI